MSNLQFRNRKFARPCHDGFVMHVLRVPIFEDSGCSTRLVGWEEEIRVSSVSLNFEQKSFSPAPSLQKNKLSDTHAYPSWV
jgi:hypothetical protein